MLVLIASNSFARLLALVGFTQGVLGIFETASYFVVRRKRPDLPTSRFHPWAPLVFVAVNMALCVVTALDSPENVLKAGGLIAAFSAVYLVFHARSHSVPS